MSNSGQWFSLPNVCGWCNFANDASVSQLKFCSECGKPMKAQEQPKPQQINNNRFQITEEIVEEVVAIPLVYDNVLEKTSQRGPGVFCKYNVVGDRNALEDNPKIRIEDQTTHGTSVYVFVPGRQNFTVECIVEGKDLIRFIMQTSTGSKIVKKFSLPYSIGCENLKRVGDNIELDPNPNF